MKNQRNKGVQIKTAVDKLWSIKKPKCINGGLTLVTL